MSTNGENKTKRLIAVMYRSCGECGRVFFLGDEEDAAEWAYGHDCEATDAGGRHGLIVDEHERGAQ